MRRILRYFSKSCGVPQIFQYCRVPHVTENLSQYSARSGNPMRSSAYLRSIGTLFRKGFQSLRKIACGVPHDAEFRMMRSSAWCRPPYDAEFRMVRNSAQCGIPQEIDTSMPLLLIWVCSVYPDLYVKKIRIITVYLWLQLSWGFCLTCRQIFWSQGIFILRAVYMCNVNTEMFL